MEGPLFLMGLLMLRLMWVEILLKQGNFLEMVFLVRVFSSFLVLFPILRMKNKLLILILTTIAAASVNRYRIRGLKEKKRRR